MRKSTGYSPRVATTNTAVLNDMAKTLEYGKLTSNRRVQIKIPSILVEEIDQEYPQIDRSKYFMWLAINNLLQKKRAVLDDDLEVFLSSDQEMLDDLSNYLEEREK